MSARIPWQRTDPNVSPPGQLLTYTLGGTDAASFSILRNTGQLQRKAALNQEEKDTYMVTVTATDPSGLSATVNVTINITNVDEDPVLEGMASVRHAENTPSATAVATYVAMDDEDDNTGTAIRWSLDGSRTPRTSASQVVCFASRVRRTMRPAAGSTYNIMVHSD